MNEWMKIVGLENYNPETVYGKKRVCEAHFTDDCSIPGTKRLHCKAYPTINLPAGKIYILFYYTCVIMAKLLENFGFYLGG